MGILDLHAEVIPDYADLVRSFLAVADERARAFVEPALVEKGRLRPDCLLQVRPSYARSGGLDDLAERGGLAEYFAL
jgi:hypothetical protein